MEHRIPAIGRTPPYAITIIIYFLLWIPVSLVDNFGGILALRFLAAFFGAYPFTYSGQKE